MRICFSSPCLARCVPRIEYQCSSSNGDWIAMHVLIWFSMNCNLAVCFHETSDLQNIFKSQFPCELEHQTKFQLTSLVNLVHWTVAIVLLIESVQAGIFSLFCANYLAVMKFQVELLDRGCSMWSFKKNKEIESNLFVKNPNESLTSTQGFCCKSRHIHLTTWYTEFQLQWRGSRKLLALWSMYSGTDHDMSLWCELILLINSIHEFVRIQWQHHPNHCLCSEIMKKKK